MYSTVDKTLHLTKRLVCFMVGPPTYHTAVVALGLMLG